MCNRNTHTVIAVLAGDIKQSEPKHANLKERIAELANHADQNKFYVASFIYNSGVSRFFYTLFALAFT